MFIFFSWHKSNLIFFPFDIELLSNKEEILNSRREDRFFHHFFQMFLIFLLFFCHFWIFISTLFLPSTKVPLQLFFVVEFGLTYSQNSFPFLFVYFISLLLFFCLPANFLHNFLHLFFGILIFFNNLLIIFFLLFFFVFLLLFPLFLFLSLFLFFLFFLFRLFLFL